MKAYFDFMAGGVDKSNPYLRLPCDPFRAYHSSMRYILALMIVVPLLLAGSAWAGTYDGEWSGNAVVKCSGDPPKKIDVQFIVVGRVVEGTFDKQPLNGSIEFDSIKARTGFHVSGWPRTLRVFGSLQSGRITAESIVYGGSWWKCVSEFKVSRVGVSPERIRKKEEARKLAEAESIRKEKEAQKLAEAEAERIQKEEEAQKLAKAERKRTEEEIIVVQEAGKLIPEIEAFAKTSPRQIDFLLLLELFHKAKPVTHGEWSEDLRDDYLALRKLVINDPEFIAFQEAVKARQAEEIRIRMLALRTEVRRAAAFLEHFVVENFSSPSAPLAVSVIGSLEEILSSEDPETLQAAAASFSSFIDRESLQVQLSHWESEFGDSIVAEADKEAPTKQVAEAVESQNIPADTASQTASDIPLEDIFSSFVAIKNANVRELPTAKSAQVATLSKGSEVTALGKVKGENWYLVARDGKELGYVFGSLLAEAETVAPIAPVAKNPDAVAVIIGNRNYEGDIPKVDYAHNDADAIRTFVTDLLGHDPDNIIDLRDATKAKIEATFGNERSHQGKLWSYLDAKGGSDVVIYYSGHGVPGQKDQRGYLLPTNADPDHPEINGYPLDLLYANLGKLEARSITVLLDACFSGGSHQGMLIRSASPILVTGREIHEGSGQIVVLTAASGDQLASWDEKAKHGLFTRYFLEGAYGAADTDGDRKIDLEEIKTYLDRTMTRRARRDFLREQEAWISGAPDTVLVQLGSQQN